MPSFMQRTEALPKNRLLYDTMRTGPGASPNIALYSFSSSFWTGRSCASSVSRFIDAIAGRSQRLDLPIEHFVRMSSHLTDVGFEVLRNGCGVGAIQAEIGSAGRDRLTKRGRRCRRGGCEHIVDEPCDVVGNQRR